MTLHQKPNTLQTDSFWMPFTANRQFKKAPRLFASAEGMHYTTVDGRKVIDGSAGLWCVNAGHGRRQIATAVERQLTNLDFAPSFNMGHPLAFDFAERLAEIAPKGLDRIFFTNSGSELVDTALKIALAYQRAIGQGTRTRLIGRERGYHGVGFGGMSVGGMVANRRAFATHLPGVDHIRHTHDLARNAFAKDQPEHGAELADDLERMVALHGADTIAAVIVEPVPGSTAVLPPPKGYLKRLRELCDQARHPADLRRGHHRLRPPRRAVRGRLFRRYAGHDDDRQGHHQRHRSLRRGVRQPQDPRRADDRPGRARSSCSTATPIRRIRPPAPRALRRSTSTRTRGC